MGAKIVAATKVTMNGKEYVCDNFTDIWDLFGWNNGTDIENQAKESVLRALLVNGYIQLPTNGKPIEMEIIPI